MWIRPAKSVVTTLVAALVLFATGVAHAQNLSISDVTQSETNSGTTTFTFLVTLDAPAGPSGVIFDIATQNGSATTGNNDYVLRSLTGQSISVGNTTYSFDVTVNGDGSFEADETFFVNVSIVGGATLADGQGVGTIVNDDPLAIHDIQGPGAQSPIIGSTVMISGIVTGVKSDGFFVQEEDAEVDADPATSEAIFVFTPGGPPAAAEFSAQVEVIGTVSEFFPASDPQQPRVTQLTSPSSIVQTLPTGQTLPTAVPLTPTFPDPAGPFDQLERVEHMRVSVSSLTVTGPSGGNFIEPNANGTSEGRFHAVVAGVARPFREPGIQAPDLPPSGSIPPIPRWDSNPERFRIESAALIGQPILTVKSGDVVGALEGPLDYSSRGYALLPDGSIAPIVTPGTLATTVTSAAGTEVTVASVNLRRFFDTTDDPENDFILTPTAYARRLAKASIAIRTHLLNPDIIGVQEAEKLSVLTDLAARIATDGGPAYDAFLVAGNDVAGLEVGFLVKTDLVAGGVPRVSVTSVTQVGAAELFVHPDSSTSILNDRPPLVLEATINRTSTVGFPIVVIITDLLGLTGVDSVVPGSNGHPTVGDRVREQRQKQAEFLANLIQTRQTNDPAEHLVVIGSFNAFEMNDGYADVMNVVAGTPTPDNETVVPGDGVDLVNPNLVNLFSTPPAAERYSAVFDGNANNVDHVLVSANLIANTTARRIEHPRIGADYPETHLGDDTTALRFSDRDPVVAYFTLNTTSFGVADLGVTKADTPDPIIAGQNVTYTITVTNNGPDPADTAALSDTLPAGMTFESLASPGGWSCITPVVGTSGTINCSTVSMNVGSAVFTLTVRVSPSVAAGAVLSNTATVASLTADPDPNNDSATSTTTVTTSADLSTLVVDAPDPVPAGQNIAYTVTIANSGPSAASTVTVTNPVAGNATFISASVVTGSGWATSAPAVGATGNVVFSKASVGSTETAVFSIVVRIDASTPGGTIHMNTAIVASATTDPAPVNNNGSATTTVDGRPTISNTANQTIDEDSNTTLQVTIGDVETAAAGLTLSAASSDQTLVPDSNIVVGGAGANRTVTLTPAANRNGGPAIITVTVRDGANLSSSDTFTLTVTPVNDAPTIDAITNQSVNANTTAGPFSIAIDDIDNAASTLTLSGTSSNQALVANAGITFGESGANRTITITPLADQQGQTTITVTVSDGTATDSTSFVLTVTPPSTPTALTYFLAEGATGTFFDEDLLIANPNATAAPVTITFFREGMSSVTETRTIAARSGITLRVDSLSGLEAAAASVQVSSDNGLPLAVERTQFWGEGSYGGHTESALPAPATRWYFAEGSQGYFDTFVLVANPQSAPVDVTLTFLREGDTSVTTTVQVAPFSRKTVSAATIPDLVNRSFAIIVDAPQPVVAERAIYFGTTATRPWSGGGATAGATTPSSNWYFAEGATGTFFDTFILLMNPDEDDDAHVTLRYLLDTGETVDVPKTIPANGRVTVNIEAEGDPRLSNAAMSAFITSDRPIVAERSVYWPTGEGAQPWGESHVSQGVIAAASRWALAEGRTGGPLNFHTYVLLGNPGSQPAEVMVEFLPASGTPIAKTYIVPAMSRYTVDVTSEAPDIQDRSFITLITTAADRPIVVERSLYWDGAGLTWSGGSNAVATRLPE